MCFMLKPDKNVLANFGEPARLFRRVFLPTRIEQLCGNPQYSNP